MRLNESNGGKRKKKVLQKVFLLKYNKKKE